MPWMKRWRDMPNKICVTVYKDGSLSEDNGRGCQSIFILNMVKAVLKLF
jgi:hypothetical protein